MINYSIIIPHFHSVNSLDKLIQSIGVHENVEVIVIDDKSIKYLDEYEACKRKYEAVCTFVDNKTELKGAGVCRNIGLNLASGKWLLFADSDDLFLEGWYEAVEQYYQSEADVIFFPPTSRLGDKIGTRHNKYLTLVQDFIANAPDAEKHLRIQFFPPWSKMIRHSLVTENDIKFDTTLFSNDVMFSTKVGFYASSITASNQEIYCVIDKPGTLTKNKSFEALYIRNEVICHIYEFLRNNMTKEEFNITYIRNTPIVNIYKAVKNKYALGDLYKLLKLYRSYHIPIITRSALNPKKIKKFLQE